MYIKVHFFDQHKNKKVLEHKYEDVVFDFPRHELPTVITQTYIRIKQTMEGGEMMRNKTRETPMKKLFLHLFYAGSASLCMNTYS